MIAPLAFCVHGHFRPEASRQALRRHITAIRDDTPDMDSLQPQAIEWLKAARHKLMRDIESAYYELERSRHTPLSQPAWAVDSSAPLFVHTEVLPRVLQPFSPAIGDNLFTLRKECGFTHSTKADAIGSVCFYIRFPARLTAPKAPPETLYVEDEFSQRGGGEGEVIRRNDAGAFAASNFGRLLIEARGESVPVATAAASQRKTTDRTSRAAATSARARKKILEVSILYSLFRFFLLS
ncbi:hypothetical protein B0H19DRAFT_1250662 [Mycena capillaripes]|nr:hypothetical protein B0H19DRAFT_1250662 [Mycena capillaripes]